MKIYRGSRVPSTPHVLAIGTFDGLHLGHQHLIDRARSESRKLGEPLGIMTFEPAPEQVLGGIEPTERRLLSRPDKMAILENLGVESVYEVEFDESFAKIDAEDFIQQFFVDGFPLSRLCVGSNFRFGRDREGTPELLGEALSSEGVEIDVVEPLRKAGEPISSTRIRECLRDGRPDRARELLSRPYVIRQAVQPGDGRGREMGFPTVNFPLTRTIHPRFGVYSVWLEDEGITRRGVANFGRRPTVDDDGPPVLEVHCLDEEPTLEQGDETHVFLVEFLREEREFDSLDELKGQIDRDVEQADDSLEPQDSPEPIPQNRGDEQFSVG